MENGMYIWLGIALLTLTCLTNGTNGASILTSRQIRSTNNNIENTSFSSELVTKNKTDILNDGRIISNQIISDETTSLSTQLTDQIAEESQQITSRGTVKYKNVVAPSEAPVTISVEKVTNAAESAEDRSEYARFFDVDKYVSPEFHNINNVFNSESAGIDRFTSSEVGGDSVEHPSGRERLMSNQLTTPKIASFDNRHQQIQDEISDNLKYYDTFTTSQRPKFSLKEHGLKKENFEYQNQANIQHSDSINSGSRKIERVAENRTQLHIQKQYYDHTSDDTVKENELDYPQKTTPKSRLRFSLRNNKLTAQNNSDLNEKNVISKKPILKWNLSTQIPTSIDPVFSVESVENNVGKSSETSITIAKRGSTKYVDTVSTPNLDDGQNFTIPPSATAWSLTSLKSVTPKSGKSSDLGDSAIEENQLYSVRVLAPSTTTETATEEQETESVENVSTTTEVATTISEITATTLNDDVLPTQSATESITSAPETSTKQNMETTTQMLEIIDVTRLIVDPTTYRPPLKRKLIYPVETTTTDDPTTTVPTDATDETTTGNTTTEEMELPSTTVATEGDVITTETDIIATTTAIPIESTTMIDTVATTSVTDEPTTTVTSKLFSSSTETTPTSITTDNPTTTEETPTEVTTETLPLFSHTLYPELYPITDVTTEVTTQPTAGTSEIKWSSTISSTMQSSEDPSTETTITPEITMSTSELPILYRLENTSNSIERNVSTTSVPPSIQEITMKTGKSNDLSTSDEDFDIRIKVASTTPTSEPPIETITTSFSDKGIDNKLTDAFESSSEIKMPKTTSLFSPNYKNPSFSDPSSTETTSTLIPFLDPKFGHKTNENDVNKRPSTTPDNSGKNSISSEEVGIYGKTSTVGTTTEDEYEVTEEFEEDDHSPIKAIVIVIVCIATACLVLVAILLIVMRKRQKRFNYGQRCTPVSLDAYSLDSVSVYNSVRRKAIRASKRSYGNPGFEDSENVSHPLNFSALANFANNAQEIAQEYDEIPIITAQASEVPPGCESKNRYANVVPLPETRVYLQKTEGDVHSDYINANFVRGPNNTKAYYIATQAPLENTIDDFWRMVWEQQSKLIIMLTDLYENGVEKCFNYLPPSEVLDCHRQFGDFQITLKKREVKEKYITHTIQLKNMVSNCWREVTHIWYLGWPERGTPNEVDSLIALLIEARSYTKIQNNNSGLEDDKMNGSINCIDANMNNGFVPIVVHCSPGTGRTGAVIACDILMREFELTRLVDIPKLVSRIRRDRAGAVQTRDQYAYIYKMINVYATKLTGGALESI